MRRIGIKLHILESLQKMRYQHGADTINQRTQTDVI